MDAIGQLSNPKTPGHSVAAFPDDAESGARTTQGCRTVRQQQTRLTPPQVDELLEQRAAGATIKELAERFGIHRTTVMAHFQRRRGDQPNPA